MPEPLEPLELEELSLEEPFADDEEPLESLEPLDPDEPESEEPEEALPLPEPLLDPFRPSARLSVR